MRPRPDFQPDLTLKTAERLHLEHVLRLSHGNRKHAAELLGLTPARLANLIGKHALYRDYARDAFVAKLAGITDP